MLKIVLLLAFAHAIESICFEDLVNESIPIPLRSSPRRSNIIGNVNFMKHLRPRYWAPNISLPQAPSQRPIRVLIFSSWVGEETNLVEGKLNHRAYADKFGYDYLLVTLSKVAFRHHFASAPYAWLNVAAAIALMHRLPEIDYFLKLDFDCLFAQLETPLETLIDPMEQYHFYVSQIERSRFTQSHTWIARNSEYMMAFLEDWADFRIDNFCGDIAQEQGAMHFMLGYSMRVAYGGLVSDFSCMNKCHIHRSAYHHHHCVLNWYNANGFGINGSFAHPYVYLYEYHGDERFLSPEDGYTLQLPNKNIRQLNGSVFKPLTVHPCKRDPFIHPDRVLDEGSSCLPQ